MDDELDARLRGLGAQPRTGFAARVMVRIATEAGDREAGATHAGPAARMRGDAPMHVGRGVASRPWRPPPLHWLRHVAIGAGALAAAAQLLAFVFGVWTATAVG